MKTQHSTAQHSVMIPLEFATLDHDDTDHHDTVALPSHVLRSQRSDMIDDYNAFVSVALCGE